MNETVEVVYVKILRKGGDMEKPLRVKINSVTVNATGNKLYWLLFSYGVTNERVIEKLNFFLTYVEEEDYGGISQFVTILENQDVVSVPVQIINDEAQPKYEGLEAFKLTLEEPRDAVLGDPNSTTIIILDKDDGLMLLYMYLIISRAVS